MEATSADEQRLEQLITPLRGAPERAAVLTDVDGTIAPIVARPELSAVPEGVRDLLASIAQRYALVAAISGRRALDARELVGLEQLTYSGQPRL